MGHRHGMLTDHTSVERILAATCYGSVCDRHAILPTFAVLHQGTDLRLSLSGEENSHAVVHEGGSGLLQPIGRGGLEHGKSQEMMRSRSGCHCRIPSGWLGFSQRHPVPRKLFAVGPPWVLGTPRVAAFAYDFFLLFFCSAFTSFAR